MTDAAKKVFVFGLDGATWNIIDPLMAAGELPNLARLKAMGTSGRLRSIEPTHSPIIWTTISSGKLPHKHGINFFMSRSDMVKTKRLWDILEARGMTVGVYGHLVTWPPRKINGFMIPDDLLSEDAQTYPPEYTFLRQLVIDAKLGGGGGIARHLSNLVKSWEFGIGIMRFVKGFMILMGSRLPWRGYLDSYYRKVFLKEDIKSDAFVHLLKRHKCDFSFYYCNITDTCAHIYWKFMEPEKFSDTPAALIKRHSEVVRDAYRKSDAVLGKILRTLDESTVVYVVSDHGFRAATSDSSDSTFTVKSALLEKILAIGGKVQTSNLGSRLCMKVKRQYINERDDIIALINGLTVTSVGHRLFTANGDEKSENIIHVALNEPKESLENAFIESGGNRYRCGDLIKEGDTRISGTHDIEGIFIVSGEGIRKGRWVEDERSVVDITPTVLAHLAVPVGRDMDGKVIEEAFEEDFLARNPVTFVDTHDSPETTSEDDDHDPDEKVLARLRDLGYIE